LNRKKGVPGNGACREKVAIGMDGRTLPRGTTGKKRLLRGAVRDPTLLYVGKWYNLKETNVRLRKSPEGVQGFYFSGMGGGGDKQGVSSRKFGHGNKRGEWSKGVARTTLGGGRNSNSSMGIYVFKKKGNGKRWEWKEARTDKVSWGGNSGKMVE